VEPLTIYSETGCASAELLAMTLPVFAVQQRKLDAILGGRPGRLSIVETDLRHSTRTAILAGWLANKPPGAKVVIVVKSNRAEHISEAQRLRADKILIHPVAASELIQSLSDQSEQRYAAQRGIQEGAASLDTMFSSVRSGQPVCIEKVFGAGHKVTQQLKSYGLSDWLEEVRRHHDRTFQHCLLVTGVGVAFAQHLGFSQRDQERISFAGLMHDLGKAMVPLSILEKPGALDEEEWAIMREHPRYGADALKGSDASTEVLDVVLHHHEYLDGSGYPDGLRGPQIKDLVRLMTIADVFGALMERRSYKPPLPMPDAYRILLDMGPKLDHDMVREFQALITTKTEGALTFDA
jgi:putative nucleotidyltransferase with HDIG domain